MYNYASVLALGNGMACDRAQALQWFRRAADMGHVKSINFVGSFYEDGWAVDANASIALDYYRRAAVGGDFAPASSTMLWLLAGRGVIDAALPAERGVCHTPRRRRSSQRCRRGLPLRPSAHFVRWLTI